MIRSLPLFLLLALFLIVPFPLYAQDATDQPASLALRTVGLLDADGTALYSLLLFSGDEALTDLTLTSTLPEGAAFVEGFWTPEAAVFVGEEEGVVTWTLPELTPQTIVGPFTYRVQFDDPDAALPLNVAATVQAGEVTAEALRLDQLPFPETDQLIPWETSGTLTVDPAGTEGLQPVGNSGILIAVPAGAVSQATTLTITRLSLEESGLPQELYWWCVLVQIEAEPDVSFSQPVTLALATRRTLTPGMEAFLFTQDADGEWQDVTETGLAGSETSEQSGAAFINATGEYVVVPQTTLLGNLTNLTNTPLVLAAGVSTNIRQAAVSIRPVTNPWVDPDPTPLIPIDPWIDPDPAP